MKNLCKIILLLTFAGFFAPAYSQSNDTLLAHYYVGQCDSLILANAYNPDFVIMDIRTPLKYIPEHLTAAINRDYYSPLFNTWIDDLPRHKLYLIHCRSGGRSAITFDMMVEMNFTKVVNMLGGILVWKNLGLPTTSEFAPLLMSVSDTIVTPDTIAIGDIDTIALTITNRANDTLVFNTISSLTGTEFTTNFNTSTTLMGADDYNFSIFYEPGDEISDSIIFLIESNGGDIAFYIERTGLSTTGIYSPEYHNSEYNVLVYPNPAKQRLNIFAGGYSVDEVVIYSLTGQNVMYARPDKGTINISALQAGMYIVEVMVENTRIRQKLLVHR